MGNSKYSLFGDDLVEYGRLFKALGHPARLSILKYLAQSQECISGDLSEELPLKRTTVYQHLMELKVVGLIKGHSDGVHTRYCLDPEQIAGMVRVFAAIVEITTVHNCQCEINSTHSLLSGNACEPAVEFANQ